MVKHRGELDGRPKVRKTSAHEIVILGFQFESALVLDTIKNNHIKSICAIVIKSNH